MTLNDALELMRADLAMLDAGPTDPDTAVLFNRISHTALDFVDPENPQPRQPWQARHFTDAERSAAGKHPFLQRTYEDGSGNRFELYSAPVAYRLAADMLRKAIVGIEATAAAHQEG